MAKIYNLADRHEREGSRRDKAPDPEVVESGLNRLHEVILGIQQADQTAVTDLETRRDLEQPPAPELKDAA